MIGRLPIWEEGQIKVSSGELDRFENEKMCLMKIAPVYVSPYSWFRSCRLWQYYCDFYPIQLIKTTDFDPKRSYLVGSHPHGMLCSGAFGVFATDALGFEKTFPGLNRNLLTLQGMLTKCLSRYKVSHL